MKLNHRWNLSPKEAIQLQKDLQGKIQLKPLAKKPQFIGGADLSYERFSNDFYAAIVVLRLPDLAIVERSLYQSTVDFPYVPGLLSFRETPPLLEAWKGLKQKPDVMVMDGHGLAHPRRFGVACHFGLLTGCPTLGCGKTRLVGTFEEVPEKAGSYSLLTDKDETVGAVLRTKDKVNPVFISPGHLINLEDSIKVMMQCVTKYRIPEPTRQAHLTVNAFRRGEIGN